MKLVTIEKDEIRLCSGMKEDSFGKTDYDSIVTQEGLIVKSNVSLETLANEITKNSFDHSTWSFSEIRSLQLDSDFYVHYCGTNPLGENACTLLELFEKAEAPDATKQDKDKLFDAAFLICAIYTQAALDDISIPLNGAGGILVDLDSDKQTIMFLPPDLFKFSSVGLNAEENTANHAGWINPTLSGLAAVCFARAVLAYKLLTGRLPYPSANSTERNADILDQKFLPLELSVNGVDRQLAVEVNKALKLTSNEVAVPGKKKKGKSSEDLTPTPSFPLQALLASKDKIEKTVSDEDFEEQAQSFLKAQDSKIKTQRTLRRNKAIIITSLVGVIILVIIIITAVKSDRENYTSKGLTSTQTVEAFYKGVNNLDTVILEEITKGRNPTSYTNTVSQMYVVGKQRQAYGGHQGFLSPEKWLYYVDSPAKNQMAGIYGVTDVRIDGKLSELNPTMYKINQKPEALTEENGITLENNLKSVHTAEYYLLHTEGENSDIFIQKFSETFTLTFVKDKWLITHIESDYTDIDFDSDAFKAEYFSELQKNEGNVMKAVGALRNKYKWLPSDAILKQELHRLEEAAAKASILW